MMLFRSFFVLSGLFGLSLLQTGCGQSGDGPTESAEAAWGWPFGQNNKQAEGLTSNVAAVQQSIQTTQFLDHGESPRNVVIGVVGAGISDTLLEQLGLQDAGVAPFLDVIAAAEGTSAEGKCGAEQLAGYQAIQGCFRRDPKYLMTTFARHPDRRGSSSYAAGRYQFLPTTWYQMVLPKHAFFDTLKTNLPSLAFGPLAQDLGAVVLIKGIGAKVAGKSALEWISELRPQAEPPPAFHNALHLLAPTWASLPRSNGRSYYDQPVQKATELWKVYLAARQQYGSPAGSRVSSLPPDDPQNDGTDAASGGFAGTMPDAWEDPLLALAR